jgi:AraC family transcriptional regulator of adaptative response/methylated-DNA-[protein]-cysteine methyltransferase
MATQNQIHYNRIAAAIEYIKNNFKQQPNLDKVAEQVHLSPFHFQRTRQKITDKQTSHTF